MVIKKMDRAALKAINEALLPHLEAIGKALGVEAKIGRGRFSSQLNTYTAKIEFSVPTEDGIPAEFRALARFYDLKPEDFGRKFENKNGVYRIAGIASKNSKYPIIAEKIGGKRAGSNFKFEAAYVAQTLDRMDGLEGGDRRSKVVQFETR